MQFRVARKSGGTGNAKEDYLAHPKGPNSSPLLRKTSGVGLKCPLQASQKSCLSQKGWGESWGDRRTNLSKNYPFVGRATGPFSDNVREKKGSKNAWFIQKEGLGLGVNVLLKKKKVG